jgi:hypothetical protein
MNTTINFTKHLRVYLISALKNIRQNIWDYKMMTKINVTAPRLD